MKSLIKIHSKNGDSRQFWSETLAWATADGTAFNTTTTETIIFPNIVIPANYMQDGRVLRLKVYGRYSNVVTSVPTITFRVRWGGVSGTVICASPAIVTSATAMTNALWSMEVLIQVRTNGATGTVFAMGDVRMNTGTAPTFGTVTNYGVAALMGSAGATTPAAVTVDLTADTALSITGQWSASNASNNIQGHLYVLEALN
jgi:hypothetical protein